MFELLALVENKFKLQHKVILHKKYRDDGITIFKGSAEELLDFFKLANDAHPLLKFTYEISTESVTFLNLDIYKGERFREVGILDLKTHIKDTETFQYLERSSNHPCHCFKGPIKGEAL
jgi:hypothetical protein